MWVFMKSVILIFLSVMMIVIQLKAGQPMEVELIDFEKMSPEKLGDKITRKYVYGEKGMLARFDFKKGAIVPKHEHPNEQITYILKGSVRVKANGKEYIVKAGQVLILPPNTFHEFEALEDTIDLDFFSPPREDWIKGTDSYLKK